MAGYRLGKIFANYISDKELTYTIHKQFKQLQSRLVNNPVFRMENLAPIKQERNTPFFVGVFYYVNV
jgi:hypothetical protein